MRKETKDLWIRRLNWIFDNALVVVVGLIWDIFSIAIGVFIAGAFLLQLYFRILLALGGA